jgi:hypothetical protein
MVRDGRPSRKGRRLDRVADRRCLSASARSGRWSWRGGGVMLLLAGGLAFAAWRVGGCEGARPTRDGVR